MNKKQFLDQLQNGLSGLPREELDERLIFYSEMIDDRMEEGLSEEEAVAQLGPVEDILTQIIAQIPLSKLVKEKVRAKKRKPWVIVLLAVGSPIWLSLLIAAFAVGLSLYVTLWALLISLWAVFASGAACAFSGIVMGVCFVCMGHTTPGAALIAAGIFCIGLSIYLFLGAKAATKGLALLTKRMVLGTKSLLVKKEVA